MDLQQVQTITVIINGLHVELTSLNVVGKSVTCIYGLSLVLKLLSLNSKHYLCWNHPETRIVTEFIRNLSKKVSDKL